MLALPGGQQLWKEQRGHIILPTVAYSTPDPARDISASQLLGNKQISIPMHSPEGFPFTCYSSFAAELDRNPVLYNLHISPAGLALCTCHLPRFCETQGHCTHLRAGLLKLDELRMLFYIPLIPLPTTEREARTILSCSAPITQDEYQPHTNQPSRHGKSMICWPKIVRYKMTATGVM